MKTLPFLDLPLILGPIAGPGTPELTAAASNAGAFAIHGSAYTAPDEMRRDAARIRELTDKPFGINLFVDPRLSAIDPAALQSAHDHLRPYYDEIGAALPVQPPHPPQHYAQQIEALLEIRPAVFSFTFGVPERDVLRKMKDAGIVTIGTATTVSEARALQEAGVDAVCAQGAEAGGHRGTFLGDPHEALIGTIALVPQVVDAVVIPVIAAGGISDGRAVAAALALGAIAAQCGTAFLRTTEAGTSTAYRLALETAAAEDTILTAAFSGRLARGLRNRFAVEMGDDSKRAPYPYQNALTRDLRVRAANAGKAEFLSLWAGQAFRLATVGSAEEIVTKLVADAREALRRAAQTLPQ